MVCVYVFDDIAINGASASQAAVKIDLAKTPTGWHIAWPDYDYGILSVHVHIMQALTEAYTNVRMLNSRSASNPETHRLSTQPIVSNQLICIIIALTTKWARNVDLSFEATLEVHVDKYLS